MLTRILGREEADAFWDMRMRMLQDCPDAYGSAYEEEAALSPEAKAERCQWTEDNFVLGAFDKDGRMIGVVGLRREQRLKSLHKATVWGMYVVPEARGLGVGHQLLKETLRRAKEIDGLERLLIFVVGGNDVAMRLYESLGFVTFGIEPDAKKQNGRYTDMVHMSLRL